MAATLVEQIKIAIEQEGRDVGVVDDGIAVEEVEAAIESSAAEREDRQDDRRSNAGGELRGLDRADFVARDHGRDGRG